MHLKWMNEKLAKAAIYALSFLVLAAFVFFVNDAMSFRASAGDVPQAGGATAPVAAPQAQQAPPEKEQELSKATVPQTLPQADEPAGPVRENAWLPGEWAEGFELLPGVDDPKPNADFLAAEKERIRSLGVGFPSLTTADYAGGFHNTSYCCEAYPHICGGNGVTASGTVPTPGLTCAADWSVFPPGTWLYIENVGIRRVEDSGSAILGARLDIAIDTHDNALAWYGFGTHDVWVLSWPS